VKALLVSGSLRAGSSNGELLSALPLLAPAEMTFSFRAPLDRLPFFNPDVEEAGPPDSVLAWRAEIRDHDALFVSSPEYAHGVPGVLKNALDWLVGGVELSDKPTAAINTSLPSRTAHESLLEILRVMGARIVPEACVEFSLRGRKLDARGIASDPVLAPLLRSALLALAR
jgi:chromate reductase, NAD(P)H dehydrogenase (quinone)